MDVYLLVQFLDAAERIASLIYRLVVQYDDAANAGLGNFEDVRTDAGLLITALNALTWDSIPEYQIRVVEAGSGTPNISSNNQVRAFTRVTLDDGSDGYFVVPAWDDFVFDEDNNNLLSPAYDTLASAVAALIADPETGEPMTGVQWTQSRTHKSRNAIS